MPPIKKNYKVGETVFGLWPGSGGLYFKGVIVDVDPKEGTYDVKFEEGTTYTLLEKHVNPIESFKALIDPKSSQRPRGRPRSSSVSRSRSRSRTPGRRPRGQVSTKEESSEKKVSPKVEKGSNSDTKQSPKRTSRIKQNLFKSNKEDSEDEASLSPKRSSRRTVVEEDVPLSQRRSTRLAGKTKISKESDEAKDSSKENSSSELAKSNGNEIQHPVGNQVQLPHPLSPFTASLSIMFYLSLVVYLHLICQKNKCHFKSVSELVSADLVSLYNPFASICIEGFYLAVFLLSMLPIGIGKEGEQFHRNSLFSAVTLTSSLIAYKHYFKIPASKILSHVPQFLIPNFLVIFVLSVIVYFRTRGNRNPDASRLSQYVLGSAVHTSIGGVNIKVFVHRAVHISLIALQCLALEANFEKNQTLSPTLGVAGAMQIIYSLGVLANDANLLNTLEFDHLNIGLMYLTLLAYPLMGFLITLSATLSGLELPYYCLVPIGILFATGMWIKMASTLQKAAFTKNPEDPSFAHMESLSSTSEGKLLISGLWGWVRHPDYLGDILIAFSFALPCGFNMFLPYFVAIFISLSLIIKAVTEDNVGKLKYGPSWDRYCQRVPSRVIPHMF